MLRGMRWLLPACILPAVVIPAAAQAQRYDLRPSFSICLDNAEGRDGVILECIDVEAAYQDGLLNQAYRRTMERLTPPQRIVLRNSQRQWLAHRWDRCIRENGDPAEGGTMERWLVAMCGLYEMIERTEWIANYRP